jgi:hypothetical protein
MQPSITKALPLPKEVANGAVYSNLVFYLADSSGRYYLKNVLDGGQTREDIGSSSGILLQFMKECCIISLSVSLYDGSVFSNDLIKS